MTDKTIADTCPGCGEVFEGTVPDAEQWNCENDECRVINFLDSDD